MIPTIGTMIEAIGIMIAFYIILKCFGYLDYKVIVRRQE